MQSKYFWKADYVPGIRGATSSRPGSMGWEMMMGLSFRLISSQYSRASMLTLRWSIPNWQMSACTAAPRLNELQQYELPDADIR